MLEVYKDCLQFVWKWVKELLYGLLILLPGVAFLIYMFVANMPDVGVITGLLVLLAICVWAPIPLRPVFFKEHPLIECYLQVMTGLGMAISICAILGIYVAWIFLPILAVLGICEWVHYEPKQLEVMIALVGNIVWVPAAHYLAMQLLEKETK